MPEELDVQHDIRPLVRALAKPASQWQRDDLVEYCLRQGVRVVNFRYPSFDGKLRELRLPVRGRDYLTRIMAAGERVDGSSLFPGLFGPGESDLYVVPVYRWAFANPWAADELDIVCRFADQDGAPCSKTPDSLLANLAQRVNQQFGLQLQALTELEFYLILDREDERFTGRAQRNYHQSEPYQHGRDVADEILRVISAVSGMIKYCHSEVGYIDRVVSSHPELDGKRAVQYEVEFDLLPVEDLGCWTTVARWLIRVIADRHGQSVTFLPKLDEGMAGSGLHVHLALYQDGRNIMRTPSGELSEQALKLIGGILRHAGSLSGFGNTVAGSYLRLVPHQEAPTRICWGERNRSSLIRVPLGFDTAGRLDQLFNPGEQDEYPQHLARPTVEIRSPDGSAFAHLLLAAITACIIDGLSATDSLAVALSLKVEGDINRPRESQPPLAGLPAYAVEAARVLRDQRGFYEGYGFAPQLIDLVLAKLEDENDAGLSEMLQSLPAHQRLKRCRSLMHKDVHKH